MRAEERRPVLRDPHTGPVVGLRADMRPIEKDGGGRRTGLGNPESSERARTRSGRSALPDNQSGREERRAYGEARNRYISTIGEGVERATLSTCGEIRLGIESEILARGGSFTPILETLA